jgi:hypothetical protein
MRRLCITRPTTSFTKKPTSRSPARHFSPNRVQREGERCRETRKGRPVWHSGLATSLERPKRGGLSDAVQERTQWRDESSRNDQRCSEDQSSHLHSHIWGRCGNSSFFSKTGTVVAAAAVTGFVSSSAVRFLVETLATFHQSLNEGLRQENTGNRLDFRYAEHS